MKKKEICTVICQKEIGDRIFSMWIQTENIGKEAKPGQFVSLYSKDGSKLLPRPISLCEIDRGKQSPSPGVPCHGNEDRNRRIFRTESRRYDPSDRTAGKWFPCRKSRGKTSFF